MTPCHKLHTLVVQYIRTEVSANYTKLGNLYIHKTDLTYLYNNVSLYQIIYEANESTKRQK